MNRVKQAGGPAGAGLVLLLLAGTIWFGWVDWPAIRRWATGYALALALAAGGVALVAAGLVRGMARRRENRRRPPLSWGAIALGIALVLGVAWGATSWLLDQAGNAKDPAAARVDAVKTGLGIGAGTGGVLALLLAVRRQWHQEVTDADTTHDATERRVTELYTKAAEQLGSDKAPVRLAGLYAMERLAQDNPGQRQTIVNVLCAYLRMPYTPPPATPPRPVPAPIRPSRPHRMTPASRPTNSDQHRQAVLEREVRLAAQRILATHLRPGDDPDNPVDTFWRSIDIDLTNATLIDFTFSNCTTHTGRFDEATFTGNATFREATFTRGATFRKATFTRDATFDQATFTRGATFREATFTRGAWFHGATFTGGTTFDEATFTGGATFDEATFTGGAAFRRATFTRGATFDDATFTGKARFDQATFTRGATFREATFTRDATFDGATFYVGSNFELATVRGSLSLTGVADKTAAEILTGLGRQKAPNTPEEGLSE